MAGQERKPEFRKVTEDFHKFEAEGEILEGVLRRKTTVEIGGTLVGRYTIETETGQTAILGSVLLDAAMEFVEEGHPVKVVFTGTIKSNQGRPMRTFDVFTV